MGTIRTRNRRAKDTFLGSISTLAVLVALNVCQLSSGNPVFVDNPSLAQFQSGRNIRHLPCIVRKSGLSGVCMFAIDCIKQNGTHLGTCIDRFYFGSCCQMKEETKIFAEEISDNSIDQNTISHFSHESSTSSTNSIFKISTESYIDSLGIRNHSTIRPYVPVSTITHMAPKVESTTVRFITSRTPIISSTTMSTTPTPTSTSTTTVHRRPTTDPPRRRTTTTPVTVLTKAPETTFDEVFESTTIPTKFTTFQMVETSTPSRPTEATIFEDTTMRRRPSPAPPRTKKPFITRIPAANFTVPPTTTRPTSRTTPKYKTTPSKRITTTKKPLPTKRPVTTAVTANKTRPTRKPVIHHDPVTNTTLSPTRNDPIVSTSSSTVKTTTHHEPTTRAPRPKPKPTAEIFKIPRPTVATETTTPKAEEKTTPTTTERPRTTPKTTTTSITSTTPKPTTTTSTTTTTTPVPTTTTTERATTTKRTTHRPTTTSTTSTTSTTTTTTPAPTTTSTTTTTTTTTTTERPTTTSTTHRSTTQRLTTTEAPPAPTSTYRPTLVTWTTVVDNKPNNTHVTIEETDWQPKPPPADWVPVPTIDPEVAANKNATVLDTGSNPLSPTTEGVQLASSSTEPNKIAVSSTTTSSPLEVPSSSITPSTPTTTTEESLLTFAPTTTSNPTTTSKPWPTTSTSTETSVESFTETLTPEISTDTSTDDYNATTSIPFTTGSPIPSLEGVDYRQVCGRRMFPEPRIVGGSNAAFGRWPWQISLRQWRTSTYLHKCGAALLNENWAITAAHCVDNVPPSDLLLRLGEYDLAEEEEPYGYQERRVQIVASHPQFDPRTFEYDLALLRFYEPVVFQPNIIPVCVPGSDENFIGQTAFVTGWGRLYEDGPLPSVLQEVAVPIINNTICETMYRAAGYIEHIPHIFICAGWKKGGYDSCEGDSGGPMVLQREEDKRFILGGVISWGIGCAEPNQPGVYTRISEFRDWINQILQF